MPFVELDYESMQRVTNLNYVGVLNVTKATLPAMSSARYGRIINIASESGVMSGPVPVAYAASKAAVIAFTRNLAHETGPNGVTVVAVSPGVMVGERTLEFMASADDDALIPLYEAFDTTTIGRCALFDEIAVVVAFLASRAGAFIHGTNLSVGGGMS